MRNQKQLIHGDLMEDDRFLLIIMDAMRYDIMSDLLGGVTRVMSPAVNTHSWLRDHMFTDEYDVTYVSATPAVGHDEVFGYRGSDHFKTVVEVWRWGWDEELGTVTPIKVRQSTQLVEDCDRMIVHFVQPHAPHIGQDCIDLDEHGANNLQEVGGEVSDERLRESYINNAYECLSSGVIPLLMTHTDRRVVVTSDHGEALGENGLYGHNIDIPAVREVPWVEYKEGESL